MRIDFTKMHGLGNDYIYINCMDGIAFDPSELARRMSPRRFSVGADGVVCITGSCSADAGMRIFNADGSEGEMCGNAARCVGKYLYERGIIVKNTIFLETKSGIRKLYLSVRGGAVSDVNVDMGKPGFVRKGDSEAHDLVDCPVRACGRMWRVTAVNIGNPHAVVFTDDLFSLDLRSLGPVFESHEMFTGRVNTEFVRADGGRELTVRVWERGSGETQACGTGACAAACAAMKLGKCTRSAPVTVHMPGGDLTVSVSADGRIFLSGGAEFVYDGVYRYENKA